MPRNFRNMVLGSTALALASFCSSAAFADDVTLTIESWRNDDLPIWQDKIIPAFEAANPGIKVVFSPTAPTEYNAALNTKLDAGTAGDLITCRPFDASLELFKKGHLTSVNERCRHGHASARVASRPGARMTVPPPSACRWPR